MPDECGVQLLQLYSYVTGQLDLVEHIKLRNHLDTGCAICQRQLVAVGGVGPETKLEATFTGFDAD